MELVDEESGRREVEADSQTGTLSIGASSSWSPVAGRLFGRRDREKSKRLLEMIAPNVC